MFWKAIYTVFLGHGTEGFVLLYKRLHFLKKEFPHLTAGIPSIPSFSSLFLADNLEGFDLAGNETKLRPLIDFVEALLYFCKLLAEEGLELPLVFHAGETLGDGDLPDNNVYYDATGILLGAKRVGHGLPFEVSISAMYPYQAAPHA
jgi:hypothetical protein